jgi:parvulin-like peptidyl-prolyl isomerase
MQIVEAPVTIRRIARLGVCAALTLLLALLTACDSSGVTTPPPAASAPPATAKVVVGPTQAPAPVTAPAPATTEVPFIAKVNDQPIPLSAYQNQVTQFQAALIAQGLDAKSAEGQAQLAQVKDQVLNGMIDQVLIEQEAKRKGIGVSDAEFDAAMQDILKNSGGPDAFAAQLAAVGQSDPDFRAGQRAAMLASKMRDQVIGGIANTGPQVHARHILVDKIEIADSLLSQLKAGADFAALAQQYSQDTLTRDGGGDLGWFPRGVLISKEVEDAAFALQPGQYSTPVQSAFGFHIVQLIDVDPARALTDNQRLALQQATFEKWLESLRATANIQR